MKLQTLYALLEYITLIVALIITCILCLFDKVSGGVAIGVISLIVGYAVGIIKSGVASGTNPLMNIVSKGDQ